MNMIYNNEIERIQLLKIVCVVVFNHNLKYNDNKLKNVFQAICLNSRPTQAFKQLKKTGIQKLISRQNCY